MAQTSFEEIMPIVFQNTRQNILKFNTVSQARVNAGIDSKLLCKGNETKRQFEP